MILRTANTLGASERIVGTFRAEPCHSRGDGDAGTLTGLERGTERCINARIEVTKTSRSVRWTRRKAMTTSPFAPAHFVDLEDLFAPTPLEEDASEASFVLVKTGPAVPAHEVESGLDAVEVTVRWGNQVLSVAHVAAGKSYWVGDGTELALPEDVLGASRAPIVMSKSGVTSVVVPNGAQGSVARHGADRESLASLEARHAMTESSALLGAREVELTDGMHVTFEVGAVRADGTTGEPITFEVSAVRAGKVLPGGFFAALAGGASGFIGVSFLGHAAIVASLAMFMPALSPDDGESIDRDQMMMMQKLLNASAEREPEPLPVDVADSPASAGGGRAGEAHKDESGAAGTTRPVATKGRMAVKGNEETSQLSRKQELDVAREFGMAGILAAALPADPNAPASIWATEVKGSEARSAIGDMFSPSIDDASGFGLGLSGTGQGGGGSGIGVGLDRVGTMGGAGGKGPFGFGPGDKGGLGRGHGPGAGGHLAKAPTYREATITTNGRILPETIQRIVRQNFGRFRLCYEAGLRGNPSLAGRVSTKFVIGRDGAVMQASDGGSDLPDQNVVACVVRSFNALSFPVPEGGIATVVYPIVLTPGE